MLEGHITAEGAVAFPVRIQWDFVDLTVKPQSSPNPPPTDEVIIRVVNARRQSISVWFGRWNEDRTGCDPGTNFYEVTTDASIRVYEGSLRELSQHWKDIQIQRADGGDQIDVELVVEGKHGPYQEDAIPFTVEAKWHSYGL